MSGDLNGLSWFKSSASSANGGCLEVAFLADGRVAMRDNEDPTNPPFVVTRHVWECFISGAAQGEFNPPVGA
ncbi:DUF397 domain-containing protein [Streptomyces hainanensis]|uniref:DUF397 domain-containing protein n=1 Tax=Streptomyces hainanensis TaxID=402648 RepID=A0A4R4TF95_9ACTN|nr:DUF397 domain-containing protein [Streptomyces hainanensis]TDC74916.1 DUF397 domain-containing protein [Streptomyces hainanensis]